MAHAQQRNPISCWNGVREFANQSAASAASLDYVKFQAVIKSAASAAGTGLGWAPLGLGFLDLAFGEAALAADLITA